ncbi:MAG: hypothetical protein JWO37_30 [Acidimicrobiales bacterium]|jgi:hypothetical protein|nr:hypothetical protein [Acidimicrobiales bacterium]
MKAGLTIGGIEVEVRVPRGPMEAIFAGRYSPFLGPVCDPVGRVSFESSGSMKGEANPPMAIVSGGSKREVTIDHVDFRADVDLEGESTVVTAADPYVIDHFFRLFVGLMAPRHDAVLLHACGLIVDGMSHVFAGQSGAGKSTLASIAEHRPLLSDEHVLVRRIDARWFATSTPFWGSYAKPGASRQAPLDTLWCLRQWPENQVRQLDRVAAVRVTLNNAVLPGPDPAYKAAVFDVAADLAQDIPVAELRFTPAPAVWEAIDARVVA